MKSILRTLPLWLGALALAPDAARASTPSTPSVATPAPAPQGPGFDIWEYEVTGNSVLSAEAIEQALQAFLGPGRRMKDVEDARSALEAAYQKAGYLTVGVDIPEQRIEDGVVRLAVVEGRVNGLYVTGSRYHSQAWILAKVDELVPGKVPDFNRVQEQLAGVNRGDDRRVQPVLKPGKLPGTVDIDLQVTDSAPLSGSLELNNQHAYDTTPWRLLGSVRYDNLFQRDHSLSVTVQTAPQKPAESEVLIANYAIPFHEADTLALNAVVSNSNVDSLGGTQVIGKGLTLGLRWQHPESIPNGYWSFQAGADFKNLRQRTQFGSDEIATPLRYLPFQLGAFAQWGVGPDRLSFNTAATFALRPIFQRDVPCPAAGGTSMQDQFSCSHQGADGSFGVVKGDLRLSHSFDVGTINLRMGAQLASQPLVSAEAYSLGGADTVRGYYEGEASGDEGAVFSTEWRTASLAPRLGPEVAAWVKDLSFLAFVDAGLTHVIDPANGQASHIALLSSGAGLRLSLRAGLDGSLDLAWPQKGTPTRLQPERRIHARLAWRF